MRGQHGDRIRVLAGRLPVQRLRRELGDGLPHLREGATGSGISGGEERVIRVRCIGASQNTSGTAYWGEALEFSVKLAVREYGRQFRQGIGLPPDG